MCFGDSVQLMLSEFTMLRETPCGYWVIQYYNPNEPSDLIEKHKRWVSKTSRKRLCYPTKEEAMVSFKARKRKQLSIMRARIKIVELACQLNEDVDQVGKPIVLGCMVQL